MEPKPNPSARPQRYLLHLARTHPTFRIPDLDSCARFFGFGIRLLATGDYYIAGSEQSVPGDDSERGVEVKSTRDLEDAVGKGSSALVVIEFTEGHGVYQEHHGEIPMAVTDVRKTDEWAQILTTRCIMVKSVLRETIMYFGTLTQLWIQIHIPRFLPCPFIAELPAPAQVDGTSSRIMASG